MHQPAGCEARGEWDHLYQSIIGTPDGWAEILFHCPLYRLPPDGDGRCRKGENSFG